MPRMNSYSRSAKCSKHHLIKLYNLTILTRKACEHYYFAGSDMPWWPNSAIDKTRSDFSFVCDSLDLLLG